MRSLLQYIYLLLLILFAGFAASSSISEDSSGSSDGSKIQPTLSPPSSALSLIRGSDLDLCSLSPSASRILASDDKKYNRFVIVTDPDGTVYFVDSESRMALWKLETGSPLSYSKRADRNMEYFIDIGDNGRLYEYSKCFGRRELNSTVKDLVHTAAVTENSSFTFGSKQTTLHFINQTNGEVFSRRRLPYTQARDGVPVIEEKLFASEPRAAEGYIMLVRTDYTLSSIALPTDPMQVTPDVDETLWKLSSSHITAFYVKSGQPSNPGDKLVVPSARQVDIPVIALPMVSKRREGASYFPMLPSADPYYINGETPMLPMALFSSDQIWEMADDKQTTLGSSNNIYEVTNDLYVRGKFGIPGSLESQSGEDGSNSSIPVSLRNNTTGAVMAFSWMLAGVGYGFFAWITILLLVIILHLILLKIRIIKYENEQPGTSKVKLTPKKRKARKAGNLKNSTVVDNSEKVTSSGQESAESNGYANAQNYWLDSFNRSAISPDASDGRWVGKLFVSNSEIGRGSNGTVVLEGVYHGRPVAVKRLLRAHHDVAHKEITNLIASDQHPNIVRLYGVEQDVDFVYISLERCSCSLSDLIQLCSDSPVQQTISVNQTSGSSRENNVSLYKQKGFSEDLELWKNGFPSPQLIKLMRDVVAGLAHLHELGIIHRDMKPQNVLISTDRSLNAKLSDMGISKRLLEDMSSLSHHATGYGSSGWQAPEQLLHGRQTRAVDLFSLGCVLFFCITKGRHPFGNHFERDSNIINSRIDLFLVDHIPEVVDLLTQLLDPDPNRRPSAIDVLCHPFFWNSEMRLTFLRDTSDHVELEDRENQSELLKALENVALVTFGGKWGEKLDTAFISDMGRYRKYNFECTRDLLRVIRNKLNHYRELPEELQEILGPVPEGFDRYFSSRFPNLLIEVYKVVRRYCSEEDSFSKYFKGSLV